MASAPRPAKRARLDPSVVLPGPADIHRVLRTGDVERLRDGSSNVIFRARHRRTDEVVALKRLTHHDHGHRRGGDEEERWRTEVDCLAACRHHNVVGFKELAKDPSSSHVFLVMEYGYTDLGKILTERSRPFLEGEVKFLMSQLLQGVRSIHGRRVVHGDLKPAHVLVANHGDLKICGFGRSRERGSGSDWMIAGAGAAATCVCYMAPELLLGFRNTRSAASMDMWSVGCIMAELLSKKALFQHQAKLNKNLEEPEGSKKRRTADQTRRSRRDQIKKIFQILGTPDGDMWPGLSRFPEAVQVIRSSTSAWSNILRCMFPAEPKPLFPTCPVLSPEGYDLLAGLLSYDPKKRLTADDALGHPWFQHDSTSPPAVRPKDIIFR